MAGCFPGTANTQQFDINGNPLIGALLTVYLGGTTTLAATFQDIGLTLPATNPLVADASGRIPLFFVNDGSYALRLTDQFGIQSNGGYFYPQIPSIGASSSGGGGTPVDPTTVASTGDVKWRLEDDTIAGWVRVNGRTIGNASSGASERANADTQALFIYIWTTFSQPSANVFCPVVGGIGTGALADFNANKQITLLDARDRTIVGLDTMGNAARNGFTGVPFTAGNPAAPGSSGGEMVHTLSAAELAANIPYADPGHVHTQPGGVNPNVSVSEFIVGVNNTGTISTAAALTSITINPNGGASHNNAQLFLLATLFWKL
jgi:hypothetical protein